MKKIIALTALLFAASSAHSALIFEDDFGTGSNFTTSTSFGNWNVEAGNVDLWNFGGPFAGYAVDLGGTDSNGTITTDTTFSFLSGQTYELSFLLGNNTNPDGNNGIEYGLFNNSQYAQAISDISNLSSTVTQQVTYQFTASSDFSSSLFFGTTGPVDSSGAIIDNVSLSQVEVEVPEPAMLGMLSLAIFAMRRFRKC